MATKSGAGGLVYSVVAIAIIVLIVSTVAVPVIDNAQEDQKTEYNNTTEQFKLVSSVESITIRWLSTTEYSINDVVYTIRGTTIAISDNVIITVVQNNIQVRNISDDGSGFNLDTSAALGTNQVVTISNGILTTDKGSCSVLGNLFIISNSEDATYGYYPYSGVVNINKQSVFAANLTITINSVSYLISCHGTYDNLVVTGVYNNTSSQFMDPADFSIQFVGEITDNGSYLTIGSKLFKATYNDGGVEYSGQNTRGIYAPIQYYVISDSDATIISLLGVIPILLFLVPVMFAVRMIQTRRN